MLRPKTALRCLLSLGGPGPLDPSSQLPRELEGVAFASTTLAPALGSLAPLFPVGYEPQKTGACQVTAASSGMAEERLGCLSNQTQVPGDTLGAFS